MVRIILEAATAGPLASLPWRWDESKLHSENLHMFISTMCVELTDLEDQRATLLEALERVNQPGKDG